MQGNPYGRIEEAKEEVKADVATTLTDYPKVITCTINVGNTTAGTGQQWNLSTVTDNLLTSWSNVKGVGFINMLGVNAYDFNATIQVTRSDKVYIKPSVTQASVTAKIFILY